MHPSASLSLQRQVLSLWRAEPSSSSSPARLFSRRKLLHCRSMAQQQQSNEKEIPVNQPNQRHPNMQPENPSLQQPEEAGKEGAKSSDDSMFLAYGDRYATRAAGECYGERRGSPNEVNPFHKDVKGDVAEDMGIPELKNRDRVREEAGIHKVKEGDEPKEAAGGK